MGDNTGKNSLNSGEKESLKHEPFPWQSVDKFPSTPHNQWLPSRSDGESRWLRRVFTKKKGEHFFTRHCKTMHAIQCYSQAPFKSAGFRSLHRRYVGVLVHLGAHSILLTHVTALQCVEDWSPSFVCLGIRWRRNPQSELPLEIIKIKSK